MARPREPVGTQKKIIPAKHPNSGIMKTLLVDQLLVDQLLVDQQLVDHQMVDQLLAVLEQEQRPASLPEQAARWL